MPIYFCKECDGNGYQQDGWDESDDAEERKRKARARREQRRARKAAKNLHMYKTCGKRPWHGADESWDMIAWAARRLASPWILSAEPFPVYKRKMHEFFLKDLRGQSGFRDMSRRAEGMR